MERTYRYIARTEHDTDRLARRIAVDAAPGMVIALDGDLGAGKTRFSQAFAAAIGVRDQVNSPTFTIIKEYRGGELPLYHMDVYRLTLEEAEDLGLDEYFFGDGVTLVEWADRIVPLLPEQRLDIRLSALADGTREIAVTPHGEIFAAKCEAWKGSGVLL